MPTYLTLIISLVFCNHLFGQSTVYVRNSTWQNFEVEAEQFGTLIIPSTEWSASDSTVRAWLETTGEEVLSFNRTNTTVPEGDTAYFDVNLNGSTDTITIKTRVIGIAGGTEMDYSVAGNGFSEPWFDDGNFHEVQTTLAGKSVIIKFKPDNDDTNMDRNLRFAIHDLPVYEIDQADFENPNVMNVMFYNVQMISFGVSGMAQASERGSLLPAQISEYQDVVSFCEAFDDGPRENDLIPSMVAAGFPYYTTILNNPTGIIPFPVNGGVITFSRWPIEAEDEIDFSLCGQASQDCLSNKGVKYTCINKLGKRYHIFGTHMDAGGQADDIEAKRQSYRELREFIADLNIPDGEPVIYGGDFNTSPTHGSLYTDMLDSLATIRPLHLGFYESNFEDEFGRIIDNAWGDKGHLLPTTITNEVITIRSLDPVLWDISEFSDHRCVLGRFVYPAISKTGGDTLICSGEDLTLAINTTHPVTYQWLKDGIELNGETSPELNFTNALESQTGEYTCVVSYDMEYGTWGDSLTTLFYPNGTETVEANLNFDFGEIVIDDVVCQVGMEEAKTAGYHIFPNPTTGIINITLPENLANTEANIYAANGKLLTTIFLKENQSTINLSHFSDGLYMVEISSNESTVHQRFVVY